MQDQLPLGLDKVFVADDQPADAARIDIGRLLQVEQDRASKDQRAQGLADWVPGWIKVVVANLTLAGDPDHGLVVEKILLVRQQLELHPHSRPWVNEIVSSASKTW
jgi:hypothetical protein